MVLRAVATTACVIAMAGPRAAAAQSTPPAAGRWFYGISAGAGHRAFSGTFSPPVNPSGGDHPSSGSVGTLDLEGGVGVAPRLAVMLVYEGGASIGDARGWGTLDAHATARVRILPRVWVEGGVGVAQLAFRPTGPVQNAPTRWWAPGEEAGAGYDVFQGPTVSILILARYTHATIDGLRDQSLSIQLGLLGRF